MELSFDGTAYHGWQRQPNGITVQEVVDRYGPAPGRLLVRGDSLAVACLQFGNILLFPQPRPALGDDECPLRLCFGCPLVCKIVSSPSCCRASFWRNRAWHVIATGVVPV